MGSHSYLVNLDTHVENYTANAKTNITSTPGHNVSFTNMVVKDKVNLKAKQGSYVEVRNLSLLNGHLDILADGGVINIVALSDKTGGNGYSAHVKNGGHIRIGKHNYD